MTTTRLLHWAGALSIVAGLVHGALTDAHFQEWWAFGVFFMFAATAQGLYGFAIVASHVMNGASIAERWRPSALRSFLLAGVAGNAFLILTYLASRTVGLPPGDVEGWDALGILTKAIEAATVGVLVTLLSRTRQGRPVSFREHPIS